MIAKIFDDICFCHLKKKCWCININYFGIVGFVAGEITSTTRTYETDYTKICHDFLSR